MKPVVLDPGALATRLTLERVVDTPDGQGGVTQAHVAIGEVWARIEPVSATRVSGGGSEAMKVTHRIWLRHRDHIESGMRLRKGTRIFGISTFRDPDESRRYLVCDCEEIER